MKKFMIGKKFLYVLAVISTTGVFFLKCERMKKPQVINEDKFAEIYTEYIIVADTTQEQLREVALDTTLKRFGEEKEKFYRTLNYYRQNPTHWESFIQKVVKNLTARQKEQIGPKP